MEISAEGFMAVFAVSGSVVFLSMQAHKRLLSDFFTKMESQILDNSTVAVRDKPKKKVRFAGDAAEKTYGSKHSTPALAPADSGRKFGESLEGMPQNWQVLYKGILQNRNHML